MLSQGQPHLAEVVSLAGRGSFPCRDRFQGILVPSGTRAHSTRSVAMSWATFKGEPADDSAAASWETPYTVKPTL